MVTRQGNKGIDPMLVLGKAVDMSVKINGKLRQQPHPSQLS